MGDVRVRQSPWLHWHPCLWQWGAAAPPRERWSRFPHPLKALHVSAHSLGITTLSREQAWASWVEDVWSIHPRHPGGSPTTAGPVCEAPFDQPATANHAWLRWADHLS